MRQDLALLIPVWDFCPLVHLFVSIESESATSKAQSRECGALKGLGLCVMDERMENVQTSGGC